MISGGDELSRTQRGNNNAYCQDNEISWTDWSLTDERRAFLEFCRHASQMMAGYAVLRRRRFFHGQRLRGADVKDVMWLAPNGQEMTDAEWNAEHVKCLGVLLSGQAIGELDESGRPIRGDSLLYLLNASSEAVPFTLPSFGVRPQWEVILDTVAEVGAGRIYSGADVYQLVEHSLVLFRLEPGEERRSS